MLKKRLTIPHHFQSPGFFILLLAASLLILLSGCASAAQTQKNISVTLIVDGQQTSVAAAPGSTAQAVLDQAGVTLAALDRVDPIATTVLANNATVRVLRVREVFEAEEEVIPFERQNVRNESLPEGQTLLIQPGVNGKQQVTYRRVFEDEKEVSRTRFKTAVLVEAKPEIMMIGVQIPFTSIPIPGRLAYLIAGNAWIMEETTGGRRPLVTSGDLDGQIFSLSPDGDWLLYTRKSEKDEEDTINTLWAVKVTNKEPDPINLKVKNVIHFAAWVPGAQNTVSYSTVEPRATAPGWQANNDLKFLTFNSAGNVVNTKEVLESNSGGIYGWWGTSFFWSPDGKALAYSRPDSVGLVDTKEGALETLLKITPLQTRSDWAWVPSVGWADNHSVFYTVNHAAMSGLANSEASPLFDLTALPIEDGPAVTLAAQTGMFAYPAPSPLFWGHRFQIAYLQAIFPEQSETSNYRLMVMDRDGSNRQVVFPSEGSTGLKPQQVVWSPNPLSEKNYWIALIYQGNLWLVNPANSQSQQVTGDGLISRIDWK